MIAFGALSGGIGAELTGGNFFRGFVIGGSVALLNEFAHSGKKITSPKEDSNLMKAIKANSSIDPSKIIGGAMAILTGQSRHIFGPDAISIVGYGQASAALNLSAGIGVIFTHKDYSRLYTQEAGAGTVNLGIGVVVTAYYCSCSQEYVNSSLFMGKGWSGNFSIDALGKFGVGVSYSTDNRWSFKTYGLSISLGGDLIPTFIDANLNANGAYNTFNDWKNWYKKTH